MAGAKLALIIFSVFAAALIGRVSLKGGRGNMIGAASGLILLGIVQIHHGRKVTAAPWGN